MDDHHRAPGDDDWLPADEAAVALRVSHHTLFRFIAVRRLPAYRIKGRIQIRKSDIDRFILEDRRVEPHEVSQFLEPDEPLEPIKLPDSDETPRREHDSRSLPFEDDGGVTKVSWYGDREYYGDESLWVYSRQPDEWHWLVGIASTLFSLMPFLALLLVPRDWATHSWGRIIGIGLLSIILIASFRMPLLTVIQRAEIKRMRARSSGMLVLVFGGLVARFLGCFSGLYWMLDVNSADAFTESLSRIDAVYFAVVTFATTGFGDIVATSDVARALVTSQIAAGFVIVTVLISLAFRLAEEDQVHILPKRPTLQFRNWPFF